MCWEEGGARSAEAARPPARGAAGGASRRSCPNTRSGADVNNGEARGHGLRFQPRLQERVQETRGSPR